jgi:hypothetical protein
MPHSYWNVWYDWPAAMRVWFRSEKVPHIPQENIMTRSFYDTASDTCPICGDEMLNEGHYDEPTNTWHMRDYCTVCDFEGLYTEPAHVRDD